MNKLVFISILAVFISGCAAEVGSEAWCAGMTEKPKGDWSLNDARDYAKYCLLK